MFLSSKSIFFKHSYLVSEPIRLLVKLRIRLLYVEIHLRDLLNTVYSWLFLDLLENKVEVLNGILSLLQNLNRIICIFSNRQSICRFSNKRLPIVFLFLFFNQDCFGSNDCSSSLLLLKDGVVLFLLKNQFFFSELFVFVEVFFSFFELLI